MMVPKIVLPKKRFPNTINAMIKNGALSTIVVSQRGTPPGTIVAVMLLIIMERPVKPPVTNPIWSYTHLYASPIIAVPSKIKP